MSHVPQGRYPYMGVPGKARLTVVVIPVGLPAPFFRLADDSIKPIHTEPLDAVITALGGYEGYLTDPLAGQRLPVSLKVWADADATATRVVLGWQFNPKLPVAREHQHLFDEWSLQHNRYAAINEDVVVLEWDSTAPFPLIR